MILNKKICICLIILFLLISLNRIELYQNYLTFPYYNIYSGSDPIKFYYMNTYRKPYRWPYRVFSSYPIPHMKSL